MGVEIVRMAAEEGEIVKEEYQLNDKYDVVALSSNENQENVYSCIRKIGTCRSIHPLQMTNNNNLHTQLSANTNGQLEESAYRIINAAHQILNCYDSGTEHRDVEADDQCLRHASNDDPVHSFVLADESSESDVDSFVMIDLTLDRETIDDDDIAYEIEIPESEAEAEAEQHEPKGGEQPNEQEQPKKQKRKRKRKGLSISKTQNKKQKTAIGSEETKKYKCALCHYSTSNKAHLTLHTFTHSRKKHLKCKICIKRFSTSKTLNQHMTLHNRNPGSFRCSICRWEFTREKPCRVHEEKCKRGMRMYECFMCKEMAHNKNHLEKHMRSHTGEINHCRKCKKQFASKLGLTQHMKRHAELFAFKCEKCHQVFSRQSKWKSHEVRCRQRQYKCKVCKRVFVNSGHLKYHMQTNHLNV